MNRKFSKQTIEELYQISNPKWSEQTGPEGTKLVIEVRGRDQSGNAITRGRSLEMDDASAESVMKARRFIMLVLSQNALIEAAVATRYRDSNGEMRRIARDELVARASG